MATVDVKTSTVGAINGTAVGAATATAAAAAAAAAPAKASGIKNENEKTIITFILAIVKKATLINAIYLVGYMNWSVAWLITPMILIETHNYWRETNGANHKFVRKIARQSAATNEKDVILANIKDLPSWVKFVCSYNVIMLLFAIQINKSRVFFFFFQVYFPDFQRCEWANSVSYDGR